MYGERKEERPGEKKRMTEKKAEVEAKREKRREEIPQRRERVNNKIEGEGREGQTYA